MPIYCYKCRQCGSVKEVAKPMSRYKSPEVCDNDGLIMYRDLQAEQGNVIHRPGTWPMFSDAAGVAQHQIPEAVEHSRKIGIPTDFTPDGRVIFTSRQHRKRYCEAIGLYDRSGGYGDPQRIGRVKQ